MPDSLQSLGDGVILPENLLPDDTTLFYDENGNPVLEVDMDDPDDELLADSRDHARYVGLALACYNTIHDTDYKPVKGVGDTCLERYSKGDSSLMHCGFNAAPSTDMSAAEHFCADLDPYSEKVVSCCTVDGKTTGCDRCGIYTCEKNGDMVFGCDTSGWGLNENTTKSRESNVLPLSEYSRNLAEGVTLSDKARFRIRFSLLALEYYNKKQRINYKLVDVLPYCASIGSSKFVAHCNFIARKSAPADASNKLFFAEVVKRKGEWVVIACRVLRGKTTAGCHICPDHRGKRVIHPTHGFRFGLYPYSDGPRLRRRH